MLKVWERAIACIGTRPGPAPLYFCVTVETNRGVEAGSRGVNSQDRHNIRLPDWTQWEALWQQWAPNQLRWSYGVDQWMTGKKNSTVRCACIYLFVFYVRSELLDWTGLDLKNVVIIKVILMEHIKSQLLSVLHVYATWTEYFAFAECVNTWPVITESLGVILHRTFFLWCVPELSALFVSTASFVYSCYRMSVFIC